MANRAMAAKAARAAKQRIEAGHMEATKSGYNTALSKAETRALLANIKRHASHAVSAGSASGLDRDIGREGKTGRSVARRCYGDGRRHGSALRGCWSGDTQYRLIT